MATKRKIIFDLPCSQQTRIKHLTIHPTKQWVCIINASNTFSLWNYHEKILIKSFNCNSLDDNKNIDIRDVMFYDRHSICSSEGKKNMKNNIIFVTPTKIFFFDYVTEIVKQISEKEFEQKNIKKVCVYSETKICIAMNDGSFKVLDSKDLYVKNTMVIKSIRGYHTKPINWIFSYSQNYNQMPRVITASAQDSLMACWNVEMILNSPTHHVEQATPCFKFLMGIKNKGKDSNNGQEIISLQYNPHTYHLLTLTESYITIWSTMTGFQLKRLKNMGRFRDIVLFNHFSYGIQCFLAHNNGNKIYITHNGGTQLEIDDEIDLKSLFTNQEHLQLQVIKAQANQPSHLFMVTNSSLGILELDKFYRPAFGTHHSFITKLSTINSRDYVIRAQAQLRPDITYSSVRNIKFQEDILLNSFYLSVDAQFLYFNLVQIQYSTMLHELKKYKMIKINELSPLTEPQGSRSIIYVNFQGRQIIIFNKTLSYYEIYMACDPIDSQNLLDKHDLPLNIDFYKHMKLIGSGYCRDIVWHQYKNQYAAIIGRDEKDEVIDYVAKREKKGILRNKEGELKLSLTGKIKSFHVGIFQKGSTSKYKLIEQSPPIETRYFKLFNMGNFYAYSTTKQNVEMLEFISSQKSLLKDIEGSLYLPERVYISYCESYYIVCYDGYFIVYKMQQNGSMNYLRCIEETLLHGYFWEKLFFFLTASQLYFLQVLHNDVVMIKIADITQPSVPNVMLKPWLEDDLESDCLVLPAGHLQISSIVNMHILLLNETGNVSLLPLDKFPYVLFCLQVASGYVHDGFSLYQKCCPSIQHNMKETLSNYGMVLPDLLTN